MENAGKAADARPSLTLITMFEYVATFEAAGVPVSLPVEELKLAHEGSWTPDSPSLT